MDFDYFLSLISKIENTHLGGIRSHAKMIPKERELIKTPSNLTSNPRKAAVLALFYPKSNHKTHFLLILRPDYDGTHASQIGFPGGKYEDEDIDLRQTALRETYEEVGVNIKDIMIAKQMTDTFIPPSNFLVRPFIGFTDRQPDFVTNHEVEQLIEVSLYDLLREDSVSTENLSTSYMQNIDVPCFRLNNITVWGATAMMLSEIKDLIKENLH